MTKRSNNHGRHRQRLYMEYESVCWLCLKPHAAEIDHVIPVSQGGSDEYVNLRLAHKDCNVARNRREHVFHRAPELTADGYPSRWHHIELHPDMWRDDFVAKARIVAKQREATRIEQERLQAEKRAQREAEIRSQLVVLWERLHASQNQLTALELDAPFEWVEQNKYAKSRFFESVKNNLDKFYWPYLVIFILGGIWFLYWGPLAEPNEEIRPVQLIFDSIVLFFIAIALLFVLSILIKISYWGINQTPASRRKRAHQTALHNFASERKVLTQVIDKIQSDINRLSKQLPNS